MQYCIGLIDLKSRNLVSCDIFLESLCVGSGDTCRSIGVDVSWDQVVAARISLRRIFTLILVGIVLPDCFISCVLCSAS